MTKWFWRKLLTFIKKSKIRLSSFLKFGIYSKLKISDEHIDSESKWSRTSESEHTSSDARVGFDLNEDELVQVSPPSRPMGRDKTKNKGKGKTSELDDLKEMGENVQGIKDRIDKFLQLASDRESRKQRDSDLRVLAMDTSNLTGDALQRRERTLRYSWLICSCFPKF